MISRLIRDSLITTRNDGEDYLIISTCKKKNEESYEITSPTTWIYHMQANPP